MEIFPDKKRFLNIPGTKNCAVLSCRFFCDYVTPLSIYHGLREKFSGRESFLLESVEGEEKIARYSFLGFDPLIVFKSQGRKIFIRAKGKKERRFVTDNDPLTELRKLMRSFSVWPRESLRFFGGFVGYVGYDYVRFYEPIGPDLPDNLGTYDTYFIFPRFLIVFDHLKKEIEVLSFIPLKEKARGRIYEREAKKLRQIAEIVLTPQKIGPLVLRPKQKLSFSSNFTPAEFKKAVKKIKKCICRGEIIQAVLSQRFKIKFSQDPLLAYRYLRLLNPSPYMYYLDLGGWKIAGASPEMLLRCEKRALVTRPIAGTRGRGKDESRDIELKRDLLNDAKEKAEHIMLVDLARNDLGRVAAAGTVKVPLFMSVEKFSHVMHIVSEVRAEMDKKEDMYKALKACFPAGTVSGAPKVRAMQIINQLEPEKRGVYAGSLGYFSFTESLDTCIIIRTILFGDGWAYVQAGAGIVADSDPNKEYQETLKKAKAQVSALEMAKV